MPDTTSSPDLSATMWDMITAYRISQLVRTAAILSLAEHCAAGPITAAGVAEAESADPVGVARFLRACAAIDLVRYHEASGTFDGTALLDVLRRDAEGSQWGFAMSLPAPGHWRPWGDLPDAVKTGKNQTARSIGGDAFQYYAKHPEEAAPFFVGMSGMSAVAGAEAARLIDTSKAQTAVDVGGATGTLLHDLMAINPDLRGIVYDVPDVVRQAEQAAAELGLTDRVSAVEGDFFTSVPAGGDIYLLRYILHDWEDESCVRILRRCREAMTPDAKLYVLEMILGPIGDEDKVVPLQDLNMLAVLHGRERSVAEFDQLLTAAGLRRTDLIETESAMSIIEATI